MEPRFLDCSAYSQVTVLTSYFGFIQILLNSSLVFGNTPMARGPFHVEILWSIKGSEGLHFIEFYTD
jgi:hypothetical protein